MGTGLVLGLITLLVVHVTARGGGRTSGGEEDRVISSNGNSYSSGNSFSSGSSYDYGSSYGSYDNNRNSIDYGSYFGYPGLPEWVFSLIFFVIIISCCCCCCCFGSTKDRVGVRNVGGQNRMRSRTLSYEGTTPCYLCLEKVRNSEWDSGEHRRRCAFSNQRELLSFPQPYDTYCPDCSERLRLWPAKGHPFYCDECVYGRDVLKSSNGQNRLNCFFCDFDCCVDCSNAGRFQRARSESRMANEESCRVSVEGINRMGNGQTYYPVEPNNQGNYTAPFMNPQQDGPPVYMYPQPNPNEAPRSTEYVPSAPSLINSSQ